MLRFFKKFFIKKKVAFVSSFIALGKKNVLLYLDDKFYSFQGGQNNDCCKQVLSLLSEEKLHTLLKENNVKLFVRAGRLNALLEKSVSKTNVAFVDDVFVKDAKEYIQMLVTDCSVLSFDFIASDRPLVFYNIEKKQKMSVPQHCMVVNTQAQFLNVLSYYIAKDFVLEKSRKDENFLFVSGLKNNLNN